MSTTLSPQAASSAAVPVPNPVAKGASLEGLDGLLVDTLNALENLIAWDSAVLFELRGEDLTVTKVAGEEAARRVLGRSAPLADSPGLQDACSKGFPVVYSADAPDVYAAALELPKGRHSLIIPLTGPNGVQGVLLLERSGASGWSTGMIELTDVFGRLLGSAMEYGQESLRSGAARDRAEARTRLLENGGDAVARIEIQTSAAMRFVRAHAERLAPGSAPVAILGEAGSGKEVLARAIHTWSERAAEPFVVFACAAHGQGEHESLLFGSGPETCCLTLAGGGTLYLDDAERLSEAAQAKLLEHLGRDSTVRVIAGSQTDLSGLDEGLFFALAAFSLKVPPLRSRREDVSLIASAYLRELSTETGDGPWDLAPRALEWLERQEWPGNVRELVNVLDRATILSSDPVLDFGKVPTTGVPPLQRGEQGISSLREMEKRHIDRVLRATNGQIYGQYGAAELLDINPNTLRSRMKKLGLGGARSFRRSVSADGE